MASGGAGGSGGVSGGNGGVGGGNSGGSSCKDPHPLTAHFLESRSADVSVRNEINISALAAIEREFKEWIDRGRSEIDKEVKEWLDRGNSGPSVTQDSMKSQYEEELGRHIDYCVGTIRSLPLQLNKKELDQINRTNKKVVIALVALEALLEKLDAEKNEGKKFIQNVYTSSFRSNMLDRAEERALAVEAAVASVFNLEFKYKKDYKNIDKRIEYVNLCMCLLDKAGNILGQFFRNTNSIAIIGGILNRLTGHNIVREFNAAQGGKEKDICTKEELVQVPETEVLGCPKIIANLKPFINDSLFWKINRTENLKEKEELGAPTGLPRRGSTTSGASGGGGGPKEGAGGGNGGGGGGAFSDRRSFSSSSTTTTASFSSRDGGLGNIIRSLTVGEKDFQARTYFENYKKSYRDIHGRDPILSEFRSFVKDRPLNDIDEFIEMKYREEQSMTENSNDIGKMSEDLQDIKTRVDRLLNPNNVNYKQLFLVDSIKEKLLVDSHKYSYVLIINKIFSEIEISRKLKNHCFNHLKMILGSLYELCRDSSDFSEEYLRKAAGCAIEAIYKSDVLAIQVQDRSTKRAEADADREHVIDNLKMALVVADLFLDHSHLGSFTINTGIRYYSMKYANIMGALTIVDAISKSSMMATFYEYESFYQNELVAEEKLNAARREKNISIDDKKIKRLKNVKKYNIDLINSYIVDSVLQMLVMHGLDNGLDRGDGEDDSFAARRRKIKFADEFFNMNIRFEIFRMLKTLPSSFTNHFGEVGLRKEATYLSRSLDHIFTCLEESDAITSQQLSVVFQSLTAILDSKENNPSSTSTASGSPVFCCRIDDLAVIYDKIKSFFKNKQFHPDSLKCLVVLVRRNREAAEHNLEKSLIDDMFLRGGFSKELVDALKIIFHEDEKGIVRKIGNKMSGLLAHTQNLINDHIIESFQRFPVQYTQKTEVLVDGVDVKKNDIRPDSSRAAGGFLMKWFHESKEVVHEVRVEKLDLIQQSMDTVLLAMRVLNFSELYPKRQKLSETVGKREDIDAADLSVLNILVGHGLGLGRDDSAPANMGIIHYFNDYRVSIRKQAAVTCINVLDMIVSNCGINENVLSSYSKNKIIAVIDSLLFMCKFDDLMSLRIDVMSSLTPSLDKYISLSNNLNCLAQALTDSIDVRSKAMTIIARVSPFDPLHIMPIIRPQLNYIVKQLNSSIQSDLAIKSENIKLLQTIVRGCNNLVSNHASQILEGILKLVHDPSPEIVDITLSTIGYIGVVNAEVVSHYLGTLFPTLISALINEDARITKSTAVTVMGKLVPVLTLTTERPYYQYHDLFLGLVRAIEFSNSNNDKSLQSEAIRTVGLLGIVGHEEYNKFIKKTRQDDVKNIGEVNDEKLEDLEWNNKDSYEDNKPLRPLKADEKEKRKTSSEKIEHEKQLLYFNIIIRQLILILREDASNAIQLLACDTAVAILRLRNAKKIWDIPMHKFSLFLDAMLYRFEIWERKLNSNKKLGGLEDLIKLINKMSLLIEEMGPYFRLIRNPKEEKYVAIIMQVISRHFSSNLNTISKVLLLSLHKALPEADFHYCLHVIVPIIYENFRLGGLVNVPASSLPNSSSLSAIPASSGNLTGPSDASVLLGIISKISSKIGDFRLPLLSFTSSILIDKSEMNETRVRALYCMLQLSICGDDQMKENLAHTVILPLISMLDRESSSSVICPYIFSAFSVMLCRLGFKFIPFISLIRNKILVLYPQDGDKDESLKEYERLLDIMFKQTQFPECAVCVKCGRSFGDDDMTILIADPTSTPISSNSNSNSNSIHENKVYKVRDLIVIGNQASGQPFFAVGDKVKKNEKVCQKRGVLDSAPWEGVAVQRISCPRSHTFLSKEQIPEHDFCGVKVFYPVAFRKYIELEDKTVKEVSVPYKSAPDKSSPKDIEEPAEFANERAMTLWKDRLLTALVKCTAPSDTAVPNPYTNELIQACLPLIDKYKEGKTPDSFFNIAFHSYWVNLHKTLAPNQKKIIDSSIDSKGQQKIILNIEKALSMVRPQENVVTSLLKLNEFMEMQDLPLPIDTRLLAQNCFKRGMFANALRYREIEYSSKNILPSADCIEALITINNELGLTDRAVGVLKDVNTTYSTTKIDPLWLEKLDQWDQAKLKYEEVISEITTRLHLDDPHFIVDARNNADCKKLVSFQAGLMRCLEQLGENDKLLDLACKLKDKLDDERDRGIGYWDKKAAKNTEEIRLEKKNIEEIRRLGANAAWSLGKWHEMEAFVDSSTFTLNQSQSMDMEEQLSHCQHRAILKIKRENYDEAKVLIQEIRQKISNGISSSQLESYARTKGILLPLQILSELEEVIEYKEAEQKFKIATVPSLKSSSESSAIKVHLTRSPSNNLLGSLVANNRKSFKSAKSNFYMYSDNGGDLNDDSNPHIDLNAKKSDLLRKWRSRMQWAPRDVSVFRQVLAVHTLLAENPLEDLDNWLDLVNISIKQGKFTLCKNILQRLGAQTEIDHFDNVSTNLHEQFSSFSDFRSPPSPVSAPSLLNPIELERKYKVMFNTFLYWWSSIEEKRDRNLVFEKLDSFLNRELSIEAIKSMPSTTSTVLNNLRVECLLQHADWIRDIQKYQDEGDNDVLETAKKDILDAKNIDPNSYRVWHAWAVVNQEQLKDLKEKELKEKDLKEKDLKEKDTKEKGKKSNVNVKGRFDQENSQTPRKKNSTTDAGRFDKRQKNIFDLKAPNSNMSNLAMVSIKAFVKSIELGRNEPASNVLQDILRLIELWFDDNVGGNYLCKFAKDTFSDYKYEFYSYELVEQLDKVSPENWLSVLPQLISRMNSNFPGEVSNQLLRQLTNVSTAHPQALVYPISVALNTQDNQQKKIAEEVLNNMRKRNSKLVKEATMVSGELMRVANSPYEQWLYNFESVDGDLKKLKKSIRSSADHKVFVKSVKEKLWSSSILNPQVDRTINSSPSFSSSSFSSSSSDLKGSDKDNNADLLNGTLHSIAFLNIFGRLLAQAYDYLDKFVTTEKQTDFEQAMAIYSHIRDRVTEENAKFLTKPMYLDHISMLLSEAEDLDLSVPGLYRHDQKEIVSIKRFEKNVKILSSKIKPRKLYIIGSDGCRYPFLLKGREDLRQDERIMQIFNLINICLSNDVKTDNRNLSITGYSILPFAGNNNLNIQDRKLGSGGLIGWVQNTDDVSALISAFRERYGVSEGMEIDLLMRKSSIHNDKFDEKSGEKDKNGQKKYLTCNYHMGRYKQEEYLETLTLMQKVDVFKQVMSETSGQDLARVLWLKAKSADVWAENRAYFTKCMAVMSMVSYILGLGDRHLANIKIDRSTGRLIHIDFGDCFEQNYYRTEYPERVPFRLTRMLTNVMERSGIEGTFKINCERVMSVLRNNKDSVIAVLEAFVYDPLVNWTRKNDLLDGNAENKNERVKSPKSPENQQAPKPETDDAVDLPPPLQLKFGGNKPNSYGGERAGGGGNPNNPVGNFDVDQKKTTTADGEIDKAGNAKKETINKRGKEIVERVEKKLNGLDFAKDASEDELAVREQVERLISEATSDELWAQMYFGWRPFW